MNIEEIISNLLQTVPLSWHYPIQLLVTKKNWLQEVTCYFNDVQNLSRSHMLSVNDLIQCLTLEVPFIENFQLTL